MGKNLGTGIVITAQQAYHLEDGDRITAPVVSSAGVLGVHSGGTATNIVESGGLVIVDAGGTATFTPTTFSDLTLSSANLGGNIVAVDTATVHSGTVANRITLLTGYDLEVYSGGIANSTTVNYGCLLRVLSDGTANDTDLGIIGSLYVSKGGVANRTSGGIVHVFISGTVNSTTVDRYMLVHASATANSTTILDGEVIVDGVMNDTTISGGSMEIFSGAAANRTAVKNGGLFNVSSGGTADSARVETGGSMQVFSSGLAKSAHLSGGRMTVSFGGTATSAVVSAGNLYLDGIAVNATVSGGSMEVFSATGAASGGTATATTVKNGGFFFVSPDAVASNTKIAETGSMIVSSDATADNTSMTGAGAYLSIENGGVATGTTVSKGQMFVSGTANGGAVTVEGEMFVAAGGKANDVTVSKGGALHVRAFGTATGATVTSAELHVSASGGATGATVKKAGLLHVSEGGSATDTTVSKGGSIIVSKGGLATNTLVKLGGSAIISGNAEKTTVNQMGADEDASLTVFDGGKMTSTTINSMGYMHISNGGQATSTTVNNGGLLYVSNGGQATSTFIEEYGSMYVLDGGQASGARVSKGGCMHVSNGGKASSTYLYGGVMHASDGATVSGVMATQGATLHVSAGANVTEIVERGGYVDLADGVTATFLANTFKELTLSNESATVHSMTKAVDITLANFGSLTVYSGGTATGTTVNGGRLRISSGGIASNTTVTNGDFQVSSGGKATGVTTIAEGRNCQVIEGGIFDFDISAISPANAALVNNLALVTGNPTFTLTVSDAQAEGTYILAGGVTGFGETISVFNTSGAELGTIDAAEGLIVDGVKYTLALAAGNKLTVTVEGTIFTGDLENKKKNITSGMSAVNVNVNVDGELYILNGGVANNTTVNANGAFFVSSGGVASDTAVNGTDGNFGYMLVSNGVASNTTVNDGGFFVVSSGGTAVGTVNDGGFFYVSSGGFASNTTVEHSDVTLVQGTAEDVAVGHDTNVQIWDGGIVRNATIDYGGAIYISSGGKLTGSLDLDGCVSAYENAIVDFDISALGPGNAALVNDLSLVNGWPIYTLTVSDTQADGLYTLAGGASEFIQSITVVNTLGTKLDTLTVEDGTKEIDGTKYTLELYGSDLTVTVGEVSKVITGNIDGETKNVYAGWTAQDVSINAGGRLDVLDGGIADNTTVNSDGFFNVQSGGKANNTTVNSGGDLAVQEGGEAEVVTVNSGGKFNVNGGSAYQVRENGGRVQDYYNGATFVPNAFTGLALEWKDWATVHSGTTATDISVASGGHFEVYAGGSAAGIVAEEGANLYLTIAAETYAQGTYAGSAFETGSSVTGIAPRPDFKLDVGSGGTAGEIGIGSQSRLKVSSGGTAVDVTVELGGTLAISSGGSARNVTENGGYVDMSEDADVTFAPNMLTGLVFTTVATIHSGTTATNATVKAGPLFVFSGGIVSDTVVEASLHLEGGVATDTTVNSKGTLYINSGVATGTTVNSNGDLGLYGTNNIASDTTVNDGGYFIAVTGNTANGVVVSSGGSLNLAGGKLTGKAVFETGAIVTKGGATVDFDLTQTTPGADPLVNDLSFVMVSSTIYTLTVDGTEAEGKYNLAGGATGFNETITVFNTSGTELGTLTVAGGETDIDGVKYTLALDGSDLSVTVAGGGGSKVITGDIDGETKDVPSGWTAQDVNVNAGGGLDVLDGGTADNTTVNADGKLNVSSGGVATGTTVNTGGQMNVLDGGTANHTDVAGWMDVSSGGAAKDITILDNGWVMVFEGGAVDTVHVSSGGVIDVSSGTKIRDATVDANGEFHIYTNAVATGRMTFADGAVVSAYDGAVFDFDISGIDPDNAALLNNLSIIQGKPDYTLTVSDTQENGKYSLAGGAAVFDKPITVMDTLGAVLDTLTVTGGTVDINGVKYTLALDGSDLSVTVAGGESKIITGDITNDTKDVPSGWKALNVNVNTDGILNVLDGGKANNTTVNAIGELNVSSGGVANDTTVDKGTVNIAGGGTANNITLDNMGYLYISSGGVANDVTLAGGNVRLTVHPGGTATGVVWTPGVGRIVGGGLVTFANSYSGVYYASNGKLIESADTLDGRTFDSFDCEVYVTDGGKTTNTMLDAGFVYVWSGGVASNTTLNGGHLNVSSGGTAGDVNLLEGYAFISSGGVVSNAAVHAGAKQFEVYFGGKATGIMDFEAGAYISIQPGGVLDFDISALDPETVLLVNDLSIVQGTPDFTLTVSDLQADGKYSLAGGATGFDKTITVFNTSGTELGTISIADGTKDIGGVKYTLALDGSELTVTVSDGVKVDLTGDLDSTFELQNGMVASSVNVNSGGSLVVLPGATATKIRENGGLVAIVDTAEVQFAPNSFGGMALNGTEATVHAGTTATEVTVGPNGAIHVSSGGTALLIKENGGFVRVLEGAKVTYAPNTFSDVVVGRSATIHSGTVAKNTTVDSGGTATIYEGGVANGVALENWGNLQVFSGGTASDITVASGYVFVSSGAVASNAAVVDPDGVFLIYPGGKFTGIMTLSEDACANATDGGTFDFDISALGPENAAFVNDISRIHGTPFYTLTVSDTQADGKYSLAGGATGFDKTITVVNTLGAALDTISIADGTKDIGGAKYTLALDGSELTVTVAGKAASDITPPTVTNITASTTKLTNNNVFVTADFDDDKGLKSQLYRIDDGAWTDYVDGVVVTENATVYFKAIDTSDNESAEASYTVSNIDKVAPTITNIAHSPTAPAKSVTVTADFNDDVDLATKQYRIGTSGAWTDYEDGVIMNENGTVYFWAVDAAGNESPTVSHTVDNIDDSAPDTTPPVITVTPSTTEPATSVTVSAVFSDDAAVATKQYRVGDGEWKDYTDPVPVTENVTVGFRATDTSGNSTTESYLVTNIENEPENNKLYDKKSKWADAENLVTFSVNEVTAGDSMVYLDKKGSVESEDGKYFNSLGRTKTETGTEEDAADYAKIELAYGAALQFSVDSTVGGTFYVYGTTKKNGELVPRQRQKITVKANTTSPAKLSTIYLEAGEYYVGMEGKLPSARKNPEYSAYYNVNLTDTKYFENADDGWNDHAYALDEDGKEVKTKLNAALEAGALLLERGVTGIKLDDGAAGTDDWVGFSDATDYRMLTLENKTNLTLSLSVTGTENGKGKAKLTIWKVSTNASTGKITLSNKGSVTVKQGATGLIKSKVLDDGTYFVSVTSTDAKKGGDVFYNVKVDDKTVFFDSSDGDGVNKYVYEKKKLNPEIDKFRTNSIAVSGTKELFLDSNEIKLAGYSNFVGYGDKADYARLDLASRGSVTFTIDTTGSGTFAVYRDNKDKSKLELVKKVDIKADTTTGEGHGTLDIAELSADEDYYISMTAKSTKANSSGSVFYNVMADAVLSGSESSALAMPETDFLTDSLAITDGLSFDQYDADVLADASASSLAELDDKSVRGIVASLA